MSIEYKNTALAMFFAAAAFLASGTAASAETLEEAWLAALAADKGYRAAQEKTAEADSMASAAKSARMPNLDLQAGYTWLDNKQELAVDLFGQDVNIPMMPQNSYSYQFMMSVPLYTGGRISHGIDSAHSALDASREQEVLYGQDLKMRVAEAYVNVLRAESLFDQAKSRVGNLEAHAYDVEGLFMQGLVVDSDRLSAQVALADARQKELQAENGLNLAKAAYNRYLGRSLDETVSLEEIESENIGGSLEGLTSEAMKSRRELKILDSHINAVRSQAKAIQGEKYPQLGLAGGYSYQDNRYQVHEGNWLAMVEMKWNIFDSGRVSHKASAAERQAMSVKEKRDELASVIALQVRQAWLNIGEADKRVKVAEAATALAERNLQITRDRYVNGFCAHTEVLDAETLRVGSRTNAVNAYYDLVLARINMKHVTGGL